MLLVEVAEGCEEVDAEAFLMLEVELFKTLVYENWDVLVDDLTILVEVFLVLVEVILLLEDNFLKVVLVFIEDFIVLVKGFVELDGRLLVFVKIFLVFV